MAKLFLVVVDDDNSRSDAYKKLKAVYDTAYLHRDVAILVAANTAVSKDIAEASGIGSGDEDFTGFVVRLGDGYSGYTSRNLWEWFRNHDDE